MSGRERDWVGDGGAPPDLQRHSGVWVCRREEIARHWIATHPFAGRAGVASPAR